MDTVRYFMSWRRVLELPIICFLADSNGTGWNLILNGKILYRLPSHEQVKVPCIKFTACKITLLFTYKCVIYLTIIIMCRTVNYFFGGWIKAKFYVQHLLHFQLLVVRDVMRKECEHDDSKYHWLLHRLICVMIPILVCKCGYDFFFGSTL